MVGTLRPHPEQGVMNAGAQLVFSFFYSVQDPSPVNSAVPVSVGLPTPINLI